MTVKASGDRKRWPRVLLPKASFPCVPPRSKEPSSTTPPNSAMMECSGRTQRTVPVPQRIDFGQGKSPMTAGMISASTSAVARPFFSATAK